MKTCDDWQLELEMRRHGAPIEDAAALEAHLTGCGKCQAFERSAAEIDAALVTGGPGSKARDLTAAFNRDLFWFKWLPWMVVASFVVQGALLGPLLAPERPLKLFGVVAGSGVVLALLTAVTLRGMRRRALAAAAEGVEAWIASRRQQVTTELRDLGRMAVITPAIAAGMLVTAWLLFDASHAGAFVLAASAVAALGYAVYFSVFQRRRLRAELAELG